LILVVTLGDSQATERSADVEIVRPSSYPSVPMFFSYDAGLAG
jgi:hypothetical protein